MLSPLIFFFNYYFILLILFSAMGLWVLITAVIEKILKQN